MSDAMSDLTGLVNAFSGFVGSVNQLHAVRVEAEAERRALDIGARRFDFLRRLSLPASDPDKLTADETSWRPAFDAMNKDVEGYLANIKDDSIRRGVEAKLIPQNQKFQLELSASMATAERELAQQNYRVSLARGMDTGDTATVRKLFDTIQKLQIFDPIETENIRKQTILPIEANELANSLLAGGGKINDAIDRLPSAGVKSSELNGMTLKVLESRRSGYEAQAKGLIDSMDAAIKNGFAPNMAEYYKNLEILSGNISAETESAMMDTRYSGIKVAGEQGIEEYVSYVFSKAGAVIKDGKLLSASKKISPEEGLIAIQALYNTWGDYAREQSGMGNLAISEKLSSAESRIRELIASDPVDLDAMADRNLNNVLIQYKLKVGPDGKNVVEGKNVFEAILWGGQYWSAPKFKKIWDDFTNGEYLSPQVMSLLKSDKIKELVMTMANDKSVISASSGKAIQEALSGKGDNYRTLLGYSDLITGAITELSLGKSPNPDEAQKVLSERIITFLKDNDAGAYDLMKQGVGKADYHREVSKRAMILYRGQGVDYAGEPMGTAQRYEIQRTVDAIATGVLGLANKTDPDAFVSFMGKDKQLYYYDKGGSGYLYRLTPNADGLALEPLGFKETIGGKTTTGKVTSDIVSGIMSGKTDASSLSRAGEVLQSTSYLKNLSEGLLTPAQLRARNYVDSTRAYAELYGPVQ